MSLRGWPVYYAGIVKVHIVGCCSFQKCLLPCFMRLVRGSTVEHLAPLFPPLPIFSGSFGFRDFVAGVVSVFGVLGISQLLDDFL